MGGIIVRGSRDRPSGKNNVAFQKTNTLIIMESPQDIINRVISILRQYSFSFANEKSLQADIAEVLKAEGVAFEREHILSPYGIVDIFIDGVAFEVKIKGQKKAIYRQCRDYAKHDEVRAVVLLTAHSMGLPDRLEGKPAYVYSLTAGI